MSDDPNQPEKLTTDFEADNLYRTQGETDDFTNEEIFDISRKIGSLVLEEDTSLYEHQIEAFEDIVQFFKDGGRECYVKLPTGTGKTNIFVELSKRLIESSTDQEHSSRIIVLEPNIDLVDQTVGSVNPQTGKRRGFKGFAPELKVRGLHSHISQKQRDKNILEGQVLVTTYNSFRNLINTFSLAETKSTADWEIEQESYKQGLKNTKSELFNVMNERHRFIKDVFEEQEIKRIDSDADKMLAFKQSYTGLTDSQYSVLQDIVAISRSDRPNSSKFMSIKRLIGTYISSDTKEALRMMINETERKRGRKKANEPEDERELIDHATAETKIFDIKELNDFDQFITKFIWRHRIDKMQVQRLFLNNVNWKKVGELNAKIQDLNSRKALMKGKIEAIDRFKVLKIVLKEFDLIICDEAHRAIGSETWQAIREYSLQKNIAILGLTATDEYTDRTLTQYFEDKAHELTKQEAMKRQIINSLSPFVHETGMQFENVGIDADGDYDRATIRQMRFSEERNKIGIDYAAMLSEAGYQGIMPAIPGDFGAHAKVLAKMLNEKQIIDPRTGELRNMRARYVLNDTPRELRQSYYAELENGELDWLTFVDVIREGWDSDQAKAMVNMRPTRSALLATQRLGRIGRTFEGAPISIVIDLYDGIISDENHTMIPPVLVSDIFELDNIEQGHIIGNYDGKQDDILNALREKIKTPITSYHTRYLKMMNEAFIIDPRGYGVSNLENGKSSMHDWKTFDALQYSFNGFLPKEILLDAVNSEDPSVRVVNGRKRVGVELLFNVHDVMALHQDKPEVNPWKLFVDENSEQWISPEGCTVLLSKRFPNLHPEVVSDAIRHLEKENNLHFERKVGRVRLNFFNESNKVLGFTHLFRLEDIKEKLVPYLIETN